MNTNEICGETNETRPLWPGQPGGKRSLRGKRAFLARFPVPETCSEDSHCHLPNVANLNHVRSISR